MFKGSWQNTLIISDWDETMTEGDTTELIFRAAYSRKPDFPLKHSHYVDIYIKACDRFKKTHEKPTSIDEEIQYQTKLNYAELSSIRECVRTRLFQDVLVADFEAMSKSVVAKKGLDRFLKALQAHSLPLHVISVTWTSLIMKEFLKGFDLRISCNELTFQGEKCTGNLSGSIHTGVHKLDITKQLMKGWTGPVVYIGDSSTDVLSMVEVDLAFVMAKGSARSSLERLGFEVKKARDAAIGDKFVGVSDWDEILWVMEELNTKS